METRSDDRKSILMIVSSMLIFGTIGVFRRYIPLPSGFLAFTRGALGGLFLLVFMRLRHRKASESRLPSRTVLWLAVSGALMGINWILLFEAYNYTTVAVATLCYYMQPTLVMLLSPVIFREKLTAKKSTCAMIAVIGMVLVSGVIGGEFRPDSLQGILLGLGAAVFYSSVVIINKLISGVDAYRKAVIQLFSAGIIMIPYLFLTGGFSFEGPSPLTLILLFIVGIVHTGIAYVLYFGSMDGLKSQSVAIFSYIDPVAALFISALFLKEPLSLPGIIGAVMIIGSAAVSEQ